MEVATTAPDTTLTIAPAENASTVRSETRQPTIGIPAIETRAILKRALDEAPIVTIHMLNSTKVPTMTHPN